jgi:hypothetical protein
MKTVQWGPTAVRTDRRTGMTKLIVTFPNYANAPKSVYVFVCNLFSSMKTDEQYY